MTSAGHLRTPRVGWVVDVQHDFMEPTGRLYVHDLFDDTDPGAARARSTIVRAVQWFRAHCDVVVFTGDWHRLGDREIDPVAPDATQGTYPPHCMGLSPDATERAGAALIPEIAPDGSEMLVLTREATGDDARRIARQAVKERRPVFIQKKEFSVFDGNPSTDAFLQELGKRMDATPEFIVCGVATDVCVRHAVEGFLDRKARVSIARDATWGLGLLGASATWDVWRERGAALTSVAELSASSF
jgi:nicotinamidase-related amidase